MSRLLQPRALLEAIRYLVARGILIRNRRAGLVVFAGKVAA